MESKFQGEMEEHKQKLDKEYESTRQNFMLEIDRLKKKMVQDLEKKVNIRRKEMLVWGWGGGGGGVRGEW